MYELPSYDLPPLAQLDMFPWRLCNARIHLLPIRSELLLVSRHQIPLALWKTQPCHLNKSHIKHEDKYHWKGHLWNKPKWKINRLRTHNVIPNLDRAMAMAVPIAFMNFNLFDVIWGDIGDMETLIFEHFVIFFCRSIDLKFAH